MKKQLIIDPHIHFFNLSKGQYHWLEPQNEPFWSDKSLIRKDFTLSDLVLNEKFDLRGIVHIEAGFDNEHSELELAWLESEIAPQKNDLALRTIAYIDIALAHDDFVSRLNMLRVHSSFIGVRHILDGQVIEFLRSQDAPKNIALLERLSLVYELHYDSLNVSDTEFVITFFARFPSLRLVLNHAGFAHFCASDSLRFDEQEAAISKLSKLSNLHLKISGFEMSDRNYQVDDIHSCILRLSTQFDENKLMLASNFPLSLFCKSYQEFWEDAQLACTSASMSFDKLAHTNAKRFYQLAL